MAFTQADLEAVEKAIVEVGTQGVARFSVDGISVEATSLAELLKLRNQIRDELAADVDEKVPFALGRSYYLKPPGAH